MNLIAQFFLVASPDRERAIIAQKQALVWGLIQMELNQGNGLSVTSMKTADQERKLEQHKVTLLAFC